MRNHPTRQTHPKAARNLGSQAEALACDYLKKRGLKLLHRNVSFPFGELDLVMKADSVLVFVEVRYRSYPLKTTQFPSPLESIHLGKRRRIIRAARGYLRKMNLPEEETPCRFDAVGIQGFPDGTRKINWVQNAFDEYGF